jgi:hypothetical protein
MRGCAPQCGIYPSTQYSLALPNSGEMRGWQIEELLMCSKRVLLCA